jgi:hypothetical protein
MRRSLCVRVPTYMNTESLVYTRSAMCILTHISALNTQVHHRASMQYITTVTRDSPLRCMHAVWRLLLSRLELL